MTRTKLIVLLVFLTIVFAAFWWLPDDLLTLEGLKSQRQALNAYLTAHPILAPLLFVLIYIAVTALSLPGAAILTLSGGALFGFIKGFLLVSFASTVGATLAFLLARYLFRDAVKDKFGERLQAIESNFEQSGAFYLFSLRLVPVIPFFAINVLMALTPIKTFTYAWVSWLGMLPGTLVYVNAGTQLGQIQSMNDILSPGLFASFVLLAIFPYIARHLLNFYKSRTGNHHA